MTRKQAIKYYEYPNNLVVTGKDKLKFVRLREGADSLMMVAGCCSTHMLVDHPAYQGNMVSFYPDFVQVSDCEDVPPVLRSWIKDWPEEVGEPVVQL